MHWNPVPAAILKRPPSLVLYTVYTTVCQLLLLQHQQRNRCTSQISLKNSERTSGTMLAISWEPSTKEIITGGAEIHYPAINKMWCTCNSDLHCTFVVDGYRWSIRNWLLSNIDEHVLYLWPTNIKLWILFDFKWHNYAHSQLRKWGETLESILLGIFFAMPFTLVHCLSHLGMFWRIFKQERQ